MVQFYSAKKKKAIRTIERDKLKVTVNKVTSQGEGLSANRKPPLFIQGGLAGETLYVKQLSKQKRYWRGVADDNSIESPHPARQTAPCEWFSSCGGCTTQHCTPSTMLEWKQQDLDAQFKRAFALEQLPWEDAIVGPTLQYRRKARLAYDGRDKNNIRFGFKAKHSTNIVSVSNCIVLTVPLQNVLKTLHSRLTRSAPQPIGHVTVIEYANGVGITINFTKAPSAQVMAFWQDQFTQWQAHQRVDIFLHVKQACIAHLTAFSDDALFISVEQVSHTSTVLKPGANDFIQVNEKVNALMVERAITWLQPKKNDTVLELFAGLGNFTYALAERCLSVIAFEGSDDMVQKAKQNALQQGIKNINWQCADLSMQAIANSLNEFAPDLIMLDPSRDGAEQACLTLKDAHAKRILYVSCNPQTWARDAKILLSGHFRLAKIALMDMFPYTAHTEMIALFERD
ncbi:23S rRNA (uracil(1939)-C(5))-methyltransferase RlmD [Alteromonas sediminis]|uniref:23S rRNA (Uracil(1939)-C(5))-methyltransferase RlmD n=1 Tax=Alteromonas sediminis TaxID=2259342 RepID=A0A3N5Z996_9ALTE|nr:23S rRNA (uracil(1939)-C(5))-methyltransferase RlmD [Alteromonas sediminis]RPJ65748.1 23S rRNA (uracil(1939)-C(5))-methyltransferase RlmD [Alteromonas sediminis]